MSILLKDSQLENNLQYTFKNKNLLKQALTHRSFSPLNNERLEFIGDSILNYSIAHMLFTKFPHLPEGDLSRIRASLVNQETLSEIASKIDLGHHLRLGQGELKTKGYERPSILSDALEAIFAAISIDSNFLESQRVIQHFYITRINNIKPDRVKDPKSLLQEKLQAEKIALPQYTIIEQSGEAHQQLFHIECSIPILNIKTNAKASSRKKAEQEAANLALNEMQLLITGKQ
ncbi:MAG: ribonuclease III [Neisseriaceae bacterium]|nr:MAG: ribonuclease III [Neisseriaceae bacterium]